jgi:hypothetical protein
MWGKRTDNPVSGQAGHTEYSRHSVNSGDVCWRQMQSYSPETLSLLLMIQGDFDCGLSSVCYLRIGESREQEIASTN